MQKTSYKENPYKDSAQARIPNPQIFEVAPVVSDVWPGLAPLNATFSARAGLSKPQITCIAVLVMVLISAALFRPSLLISALYWLMWTAFMANALMRLAATGVTPQAAHEHDTGSDDGLPSYSAIVALYKEAALVPQILSAMSALDYPHHRLEVLFALEADDQGTLTAFHAQPLPAHMRIIEVPPGLPRTKPRALNYALERSAGEHVVIYDAEDRPHPLQLREAASTFAAGDPKLACLQAPLRPVGGTSFIARQFAAEYAVQFDVLLPALNRLGLPFPLGGTSNHFKADVLKSIGAWDAWNVTEDADLGLRLAQYGYLSGLLTRPTFETPPADSQTWIPQRTRWIKGYMQTLLVHTRLNMAVQTRVWSGMGLGIALSLAAAVCYAPLTVIMVLALLMTLVQAASGQVLDILHWRDVALFLTGSLSAIVSLLVGARRAGTGFSLTDALSAPAYWCLQSLAAGFATYQLATKPFHWDKTEHTPAFEANMPHKALYEDKSSAYGLEDDYIGHPHHLADHRLG